MLRRKVFIPGLMDELLNERIINGCVNENFRGTLPAVNIKENDNDFTIDIAAPGFEKKDFKIDLNNNLLEISSEKEIKSEANNDNLIRREFSYNSFKRYFTLPDMVESDKIKATYKDGILSVSIPKKEEAKVKPVRQISVS